MRRISDGQVRVCVDTLVSEEPLEIRIGDLPLAVAMRTPGHDFELALGFLLTEGLVTDPADVRALRYCVAPDEDQHHNVLTVDLARGIAAPAPSAARPFLTTSSCGLCGKASIDQVRARSPYRVADDPLRISTEVLASLPGELASRQVLFGRTGGLHAAGLFDPTGRLLCVREDIGRHNAFDKVIGWAASAGRLPLRSHLILASGRASFELTQKALMAGIPLLAAVSAPSSLAVELAEESGMTLVGFLRDRTMNLYTGEHRLQSVRQGGGTR
ncbi:MAG: formate dehydrogenase accessory sulfurtransferase FdhD [Acidimicrobiales bacterium]